MKSQPLTAFDKLYWFRIGSAILAGVLTQSLQTFVGTDWSIGVSIGIAIYLITYYAAWFGWYRGVPRGLQGKIYTTGIGGFVLVFLFTWMLLFTLRISGYPL